MVKEPLFNIISLNHEENTVSAALEINQHNEIFEGHFPDHPVVPGACMLQIVKEVLEKTFAKSLRIIKADNIKFLSLIEPGNVSTLQLNLTYQLIDGEIKINAGLMAGEVVCMKLQGTFQTTQP